jgi:hypothetical protein
MAGGKYLTLAVVLGLVVSCSSSGTTSNTSTVTTAIGTLSPEDIAHNEAARAASLNRANYQPITDRDFALLVKDPVSHRGQRIVIYGQVTQSDTETGAAFRADTGATPPSTSYPNYSQNSFITVLDPTLTKAIVEKDILRMYVEVSGPYSYNTTSGRTLTVPEFTAFIIDDLSGTRS